MMTCAERMRRIRVMNIMDNVYNNGSNQVKKADDGTMTYLDKEGNTLVKASMKKIETR